MSSSVTVWRPFSAARGRGATGTALSHDLRLRHITPRINRSGWDGRLDGPSRNNYALPISTAPTQAFAGARDRRRRRPHSGRALGAIGPAKPASFRRCKLFPVEIRYRTPSDFSQLRNAAPPGSFNDMQICISCSKSWRSSTPRSCCGASCGTNGAGPAKPRQLGAVPRTRRPDPALW
jgi:hypothetical protein